jgi:multiple sugar transport system substrate-binding protein
MKKQVRLALLNLTLIAAFALSACGGAPTSAPAPAQPTAAPAAATAVPAAQMVMIRWRTRPDNTAEQDVYQQISDDLSKQLAPQGITRQYDPAPVTGYFDKLTTEFSAGNAPDVVWIAGAALFCGRGGHHRHEELSPGRHGQAGWVLAASPDT